jgi:hypothetical protein
MAAVPGLLDMSTGARAHTHTHRHTHTDTQTHTHTHSNHTRLCNTTARKQAQDTSSRLERLRTDLRSWRARVDGGELQTLDADGQRAKSRAVALLSGADPGSCWSSFIPSPHFKARAD